MTCDRRWRQVLLRKTQELCECTIDCEHGFVVQRADRPDWMTSAGRSFP
jgi:hypothetical protein